MTAYVERALLISITLGVFFLLVMPLIVATGTPLLGVTFFPNSYYPYIVPKAVYARSTIEFVTGLWLVLAVWNPAYRPPRSWLLAIFGVYVLVALISGVAGVSPQRSLWSTYERMGGVVDLAHWFALTVVVTSLFRGISHWRVLLNFNLGVSLVMGVLGLLQHYSFDFEGHNLFVFGYLESARRIDSTLGNATFVGAFMMVNILIAAGLLAQSFRRERARRVPAGRSRRRGRRRHDRREAAEVDYALLSLRLFWIATIVLDLWVMSLSGTRGAGIGLGIGLLSLGVGYALWGQSQPLKVAAMGLVGLLVVVGLFFAFARNTEFFDRVSGSNILVKRLANIGIDDSNVRGRWESIKAGLQGFAARPLLGWGPENYSVAYDRYIPAKSFALSTESFDQAHNKVIEELTTKGGLGFLAYMSMWALMIWAVVRRIRNHGRAEDLLIWFVGAAMIGYFVQNLFLFDTPATILQFALLVGFAVNLGTTFEKTEEAVGSKRVPDAAGPAGSRRLRNLPGELAERLRRAWSGSPISGIVGHAARSRVLGSTGAQLTGLVLVLMVVGLVIYRGNWRIYNGATSILDTDNPAITLVHRERYCDESTTFEVGLEYFATSTTLEQRRQFCDVAITWPERFENFERTIGSFDQLGNYPRFILFNQLMNNWRGLSDSDAEAALKTVEIEAARALAAEPKEWRVYVSIATLYQVVSSTHPSYLDRAQELLDEALELAPERLEIYQSLVGQRLIERDYDLASETIARYLELSPDSAFHFALLQQAIDRAVAASE